MQYDPKLPYLQPASLRGCIVFTVSVSAPALPLPTVSIQ